MNGVAGQGGIGIVKTERNPRTGLTAWSPSLKSSLACLAASFSSFDLGFVGRSPVRRSSSKSSSVHVVAPRARGRKR